MKRRPPPDLGRPPPEDQQGQAEQVVLPGEQGIATPRVPRSRRPRISSSQAASVKEALLDSFPQEDVYPAILPEVDAVLPYPSD